MITLLVVCRVRPGGRKEVEGALVRQVRRGLVVVLAADPGKGVIVAGIVVDRGQRVAVEAAVDLCLRLLRAESVSSAMCSISVW